LRAHPCQKVRDAFHNVVDQDDKIISACQILRNLVLVLIDSEFALFPLEFDLARVDVQSRYLQCQVRSLFTARRMT
jgi:hypothetical protein